MPRAEAERAPVPEDVRVGILHHTGLCCSRDGKVSKRVIVFSRKQEVKSRAGKEGKMNAASLKHEHK